MDDIIWDPPKFTINCMIIGDDKGPIAFVDFKGGRMSKLRKTKFRAILKLEDAIKEMLDMKFLEHEIREITRDILRREMKLTKEEFEADIKALKKQ